MANIRRKEVTRTLRVKLKGRELEMAGASLAEELLKLDLLEKEKKKAVEEFNETAKEIEGRVQEFAVQVREGREDPEVACEEIYDYEKETVRLWRKDTQEWVGEAREMTQEEIENPHLI